MKASDISSFGVVLFALLLAAPSAAQGQESFSEETMFKDPSAATLALALPDIEPVLELLIEFKPGTDVADFAARRGLVVQRVLVSNPNLIVLKAPTDTAARQQMNALLSDRAVHTAYYNHRSHNVPRAFVPNDPFYNAGNPGGFPGQWHLFNPVRPDLDSNVRGAWNRDLTGAGVTIGITDDGVETAHPDLAPNYVEALSWNFAEHHSNPNPPGANDNHGTSVAGVAAARGGNGLGVTGAAPLASIAGVRVPLGVGGTVADFVDATLFQSSGANRNIKVKNHSYGPLNPFQPSAAERAAVETSAAAGTIHVWASGNERGKAKDDANKDAVPSSPHVIAVAALSSGGIFADYSCYGANVLVTAPSNSRRQGEHGEPGTWTGIATTDRSGDTGYNPGPPDFGVNSFQDRAYTGDFGGTSSAAPLVAGIMALGVQANPVMDVRMARHLLARTSRVVDANDSTLSSDGGWKTNAAGYPFNPNYGFGLIDADAFTRQASQFSGVTPLQIAAHAQPVSVNGPIPDLGSVSRTFSVDATTPIEEVEIYLDIQHTFRGDLEAFLTSPGGTTTRLFSRNGLNVPSNRGGIDWWFLANAFRGENPAGTWTLTVHDRFERDTGTWNSFQARVRMGELIPATTPTPPTITGFAPVSGAAGASVTIAGTKFTGVTAVTFNGVNANFVVNSASQIIATVPAGATSGPIQVVTPGGAATSTQSFQIELGPSITGFQPSSGSAGATVTINGANFTGTTAVTFNNVQALFTVTSPNQITATVPDQATTGRVSVSTPAGSATSSSNFTVTTVPVISTFSPASGGPNSIVTLLGANFLGATSVTFNGLAAEFTVDNSTRITATVPVGASTGPIVVIAPQGNATSAAVFTVFPAPTLAGFNPGSGPAGTTVVITGTHLLNVSAVEFNGVAATFTVDSAQQITAVAPAGAGTGPIRVTTSSGTAISVTSFTVVGGPANDPFVSAQVLTGSAGTIQGSNVGASKESGEPNHANNTGGRSIWYRWQAPESGAWVFDTIGSTFDTLLAVYRGDSLAALNEIGSSDDAGGGTNSTVVVTVDDGVVYRIAVDGFNADPTDPTHARSGALTLNWNPLTAGPVIHVLTPSHGTIGSRVTIDGEGLAGSTAVEFGTVPALTFTVLSPTRLSALVPPGATSAPIRVITPAGHAVSPQSFTVDAGPANDRFADAQHLTGTSGTVAGSNIGATKEPGESNHAGNVGGASVWFTWTAPADGTWSFDTGGSGFDTLLAVYVGSSIDSLELTAENDDAPDLANRASRVTFAATSGSAYHLAIDGYVGDEGPISLSWSLTPNVPAITHFSPGSGSAGVAVTIAGINFAGATSVRFNEAPSLFEVSGPTQIQATVPLSATTGPIQVSTPNGTATSSELFVITGAPSNDHFAAARILDPSGAITAGSNAGATREPNEPDHAGNSGGRSTWYRWTAPAGGRWTLDTVGSRFDTLLGVYVGTGLSDLTQIAANDDAPGVLISAVTFDTTPGVTYHVAVDGYEGESGNFILRLMPAAPAEILIETGFEPDEGYSTLTALSGQAGWVHLGSGGNGIVSEFFAGMGQQAFIGFQPPLTAGDALFVWRPLDHVPDLEVAPVIRFSVLMRVVDSLNFAYDDFDWSVYNRAGQRLFTVNFDNNNLGVYYRLDGDSNFVWTELDFDNNFIYELVIVIDFGANQWSAFLDGQPLVTQLPVTTTGLELDLGDIDAVWIPRNDFFPGNNYLLFDNYRVAAETTLEPTILIQPKAQTAIRGSNVTLGVGVRGGEPLAYEWRFNGVAVPGATNAVLNLANVAPAQAGLYSVTCSNVFGSATSQNALLTVDMPLPIELIADSLQPDGRFHLNLTGNPGTRVAIEASSDLRTWTELDTVTIADNPQPYVDLDSSAIAWRFYRARRVP